MALRGDLKDFNLTQIFNLINLAKKTGLLTIGGVQEKAKVYFKEGKLIHASLDGQQVDLAGLLEKGGKMEGAQSHLLPLTSRARSDKELGLLLINAGLVNREEILEAVRGHLLETVYQLFTLTEGPFLFQPNILPPQDKIAVPIHLENVILEGTRRVRERKRLQQEVPDLGMALRFTAHPDIKLKRITLSPEEWRVVASISPSRTIEEIARTLSLNDFQIRKVVYGLLSAGLVELVPLTRPAERYPAPPKEEIKPAPVRRGVLLRLIDRIRRL
jgi:hypothetical protein